MALSKEQIEWMKIYYVAPAAANNFFKTLIAIGTAPFMTRVDTIAYEEVKEVMVQAKILPRSAEFPIGKQDGFERKAVSPDIIKNSIPFGDGDGLEMVAGQAYLNGQVMDNKDKKRNERILKIKTSIEDMTNNIAAEMFFSQTYSPNVGSKITFTKATEATIVGTEIKNFPQWAREREQAYQKENKLFPSHRFIGADIFNRLIAIAEGKANAISTTQIGVENIGNTETQYIIVGGKKYYVLPNAQNAKGLALNTDGLFILYNNNAIIPGYIGLTNVNAGKSTREEADILIRETSANEKTGYAETLGESGYIPILVAPKLIWKITITGVEGIK